MRLAALRSVAHAEDRAMRLPGGFNVMKMVQRSGEIVPRLHLFRIPCGTLFHNSDYQFSFVQNPDVEQTIHRP